MERIMNNIKAKCKIIERERDKEDIMLHKAKN